MSAGIQSVIAQSAKRFSGAQFPEGSFLLPSCSTYGSNNSATSDFDAGLWDAKDSRSLTSSKAEERGLLFLCNNLFDLRLDALELFDDFD